MNYTPFFVAGEVYRIRQATGDYAAVPTTDSAIRAYERMTARIASPLNSALETAAAVMAHLTRFQKAYGQLPFQAFERKFCPSYGEETKRVIPGGWEWRLAEGTVDVWYRFEYPNQLRYGDWLVLKGILRQYKDVSDDLSEKRRAAVGKRWEKAREQKPA